MKKILVTLFILSSATVANADVLYWMVSDEQAAGADSSSGEYYAFLKVSDSNSNLNPDAITLDRRTGAQVYDAADWGDQFAANISGYADSSYYFYVELANGLRTDPVNYANIPASYLYSGGITTPTGSFAEGAFGQVAGTSYNVPEPTSGLLFLVGGMLLGLKRRRQKV